MVGLTLLSLLSLFHIVFTFFHNELGDSRASSAVPGWPWAFSIILSLSLLNLYMNQPFSRVQTA